ncbi:hypothetical protein [Thiomicrorhabdus cannonii]|uniref:hypothetical protein n=1 Tax=Thiomicrorhabdus cannonii TaxID=2748011 RepID=UPI0015BAA154|nr:hypothetical protein [Thiomicrorhabdus cannonii]
MKKRSENSTGRVEAISEKEKTGLQKGDLEKQAGINRSPAYIRHASLVKVELRHPNKMNKEQ